MPVNYYDSQLPSLARNFSYGYQHMKTAGKAKGFLSKAGHLMTGIIEMIPLVGSVIASIDKNIHSRGLMKSLAKRTDLHFSSRFSHLIDADLLEIEKILSTQPKQVKKTSQVALPILTSGKTSYLPFVEQDSSFILLEKEAFLIHFAKKFQFLPEQLTDLSDEQIGILGKIGELHLEKKKEIIIWKLRCKDKVIGTVFSKKVFSYLSDSSFLHINPHTSKVELLERKPVVAKLAEATGFDERQFDDLNDVKIGELIPVYLDLVAKQKDDTDIKKSVSEGTLTHVTFSSSEFNGLPTSISLYLDPDTGKLRIPERQTVAAKLAEATGFKENQFKDLSDEQMAELSSVYLDLANGKTSADITTSKHKGKLQSAVFSQNVFTHISDSLFLTLDHNTGKLVLLKRQPLVARLAKATGFKENQLKDLSDEQMAELSSVYLDLVDEKRSAANIKKSASDEQLTYATFSRRVFEGLTASTTLYLDPDTGKLRIPERQTVVAKLAEATGFEEKQFEDLSDVKIGELSSVYIDLAEKKKSATDIKKSASEGTLTHVTFSSSKFNDLPTSISLYLDPDTGKLRIPERQTVAAKLAEATGFKENQFKDLSDEQMAELSSVYLDLANGKTSADITTSKHKGKLQSAVFSQNVFTHISDSLFLTLDHNTGKLVLLKRQPLVARLAKAMGFKENQLKDLSDEQMAELSSVYLDFVDKKRSAANIKKSASDEQLTYATFSRRIFEGLTASISLYLDPKTGKLRTPDRRAVVAKLVEATGFEKHQFENLSDEQIANLNTVYLELEGSAKTSDDIRTSMTGERLTFAKFSRRVFKTLTNSISLYIDPDTEKLQLFEEFRGFFDEGGYKKSKLARGEVKDYVKGTFKPEVSSSQRDEIVEEQLKAYRALRSKVAPEQLKYLCLPEVVTYKSAKTGGIKKILLSPYMNKHDIARANFSVPNDQRVRGMLQIAKGVKAMHDSGYAHIDIKGPNILLHIETDGTYVLKLTDFDLIIDTSKPGKHSGFENVLTKYRSIAPELDSSSPDVPNSELKKCDIYSLGVIFCNFIKYRSSPKGYEKEYEQLATDMIDKDPAKRPSIENVITRLEAMQ